MRKPEQGVHGVLAAEEQGEVVSLCSLMANGRMFGIDTRRVREVLGMRRLDRVPLAPAFIAGVLPYRGEVLTAVSLRSLLGMAPATGTSCVLVLHGDAEEERFGLMVDSVGGVVMLSRALMAANPSTLDEAGRAMFAGSYRVGHGLLVQLDPARLRPSQLLETGLFGQGGRGRGGKPEGEMRCER